MDDVSWLDGCRCDVNARWDEARARLDTISATAFPTPIEPGIYPAVHALMAIGIPTCYSCEGHRSSERSWTPPYISLGQPGTWSLSTWQLRLVRSVLGEMAASWEGRCKLSLDLSVSQSSQGDTLSLSLHARTPYSDPEGTRLSIDQRLAMEQDVFTRLGDQLRAWFFDDGGRSCPEHGELDGQPATRYGHPVGAPGGIRFVGRSS
jgi:hypothetical protein